MEGSNVVLDVRNLSKLYGARLAVNNISLTVNSGEIFGFLGPNGAGKSTFIKAITGLAKFDTGEVYICGKNIKTQFCEAISNVGAIIESPEMYGHMSGYDNLTYFASFYPNVTKQKIDEIIEFVGMTARAREKMSKYSLGMKQRLGIAQAMLNDPKILILDEPTNGLDPAGIKEVRDLFIRLAKERGITILISSHILSEIQMMCSKVAIINKGTLIAVKNIEELTAGKDGKHTVQFSVNDKLGVAKYLDETFGLKPFFYNDNLRVDMPKEDIPKVIGGIIAAGFTVMGAQPVEKTLEEMFLELTGGSYGIE